MDTYVFLNPDGTQDFGLLALIAAKTGVTYAHQCAGLATETREIEGFAIPLGGPELAAPLEQFFKRRFKGSPPIVGSKFAPTWSDEDVAELQKLVGSIACWKTERTGQDDERTFLQLDVTNLDGATEAWIPVKTAYGPAVLIFANCD